MSEISINDFVERKQLTMKAKEYAPSVITIFICLALMITIIIPQLQAYFDARTQDDAKRQQIAILKNNVDSLAQTSEVDITKKFDLAAQALPTEKNFIDILSSIADAANKSNIALADYSFSVGKISVSSDKTGKPAVLEVKLTVTGTADRIAKFLGAMQSEFPLSEIVDMSIDETSNSLLTIDFFYEPLQKITFDSKSPIVQLTQQDLKTLNTLGSMQ